MRKKITTPIFPNQPDTLKGSGFLGESYLLTIKCNIMKTASDIQKRIFEDLGIKTSVRKNSGSMKGYLTISPMFQDGKYPNFTFDYVKNLELELSHFDNDLHPVFCSIGRISVFQIEDEREQYKRERKPKEIEQMKSREWGSKNSQMRLDKASRRAAKIPLWQKQA